MTNLVRTRVQVWRNRRSAASLMHLDSRLLADIGLTRRDVAVSLRGPQDPSRYLQHLAEERRAGARRLAEERLARVLG
ncbi:DUF1127 domain-containing protein, partial [Mycobacterium tuberculosis]|nr:DUF1127 domain-containing protein [Mycobacterium tuberculosis]